MATIDLKNQIPPTKYHLPLVVIVGPTASGKTSLSIELAKKFNGEIISADSRAIYKGMDIGTAKPSAAEQAAVPHWGIDLVEPGEYFSAADFKQYADQKITEIRSRGRIPFLVGGTGLYVDSVVFNYQFGPPADSTLRAKLEQMSLGELHDYCNKNNILLPENHKNKRYVVRAIENNNFESNRSEMPQNDTIIVGITTEKDILRARIQKRSEQLFKNGVVDEARLLGKKYGWNNEAMKSNIYPLVHEYLDERVTLDETRQKFFFLDWHLAKRQMTWMRRNKFIQWLPLEDAKKYLDSLLANR